MSPDAQQRADGVTMTTAQIGRAGELLVQCRLLLLGLDSSAMSTDAGIDLVVYPLNLGAPTSRFLARRQELTAIVCRGAQQLSALLSGASPAAVASPSTAARISMPSRKITP